MRPYYSGSDIKIFNGDCIDVLRGMDAESIDMCITSPPYWGLRDYGTAEWEGGNSDCNHSQAKEKSRYDYSLNSSPIQKPTRGTDAPKWKDKCPSCGAIKKDSQLGLEPTYQEYIDKLITIFDEVKRVLKDTGTCWVNLGDTFASGNRDNGKVDLTRLDSKEGRNVGKWHVQPNRQGCDVTAKSLIGIPERFAISMTDAGWIRRNTIIWYKPNCMPSSADDRFTVDFEYLYFFTKKKKYWFEQQFDPYDPASLADFEARKKRGMLRWGTGEKSKYWGEKQYDGDKSDRSRDQFYSKEGRNKRCVWKIPTQSYSDAHFATYPEELVYTPIKAGCPQYICKKCGEARETISNCPVIPEYCKKYLDGEQGDKKQSGSLIGWVTNSKYKEWKKQNPTKFVLSNCGCNAGFKDGTVLDPFMGSGTTLKVARELGRNGIGIELNPEYIEMAKKRINVSQELLKI